MMKKLLFILNVPLRSRTALSLKFTVKVQNFVHFYLVHELFVQILKWWEEVCNCTIQLSFLNYQDQFYGHPASYSVGTEGISQSRRG
jgi:hypothetical protein